MIFKRIAFVLLALAALPHCANKDSNSLAEAQQCLDNVPDSNPTAANACMTPIANLQSEAADVLKCSIAFMAGGLTTTKVANAYKALEDNPSNKVAIFMATLALTPTASQQAASYCDASDDQGLIYIAQLSVIGSVLANAIGGYDPTSGVPPTQTQITAAITACQSGGCDDATVGTAAETLGEGYCAQPGASTDVCPQLTQAIANSNGNPASVAQQLYTLLSQQ